jgi:hypothetical protein
MRDGGSVAAHVEHLFRPQPVFIGSAYRNYAGSIYWGAGDVVVGEQSELKNPCRSVRFGYGLDDLDNSPCGQRHRDYRHNRERGCTIEVVVEVDGCRLSERRGVGVINTVVYGNGADIGDEKRAGRSVTSWFAL